jgi:ribosome maturation factor RimP
LPVAMDDRSRAIEALLTASVEDLGYELVRVSLTGDQRATLLIMVERRDRVPMNVDHCADVSRAVSAILDVEDPIDNEYRLEVSSPGIDRPLVRLEDFRRFAGFETRIELTELTDGRRRFRGRLLGLDEEERILVETDTETFGIPFALIHSAKLVLTDELIEASQDKTL